MISKIASTSAYQALQRFDFAHFFAPRDQAKPIDSVYSGNLTDPIGPDHTPSCPFGADARQLQLPSRSGDIRHVAA
ncbi:hypothetical protein COL8621_00428 [Actibacterium lipolyticum]|uniref:Uncharacterized protein n=1 Tax=Actibacterium lipolyticum TaxID=1524263 RepID=A0A238JL84_9RHOB|nr:hypothetical protein COL8621_00428 [Actibacterium lipolyticum]